jgi:elongation factor G
LHGIGVQPVLDGVTQYLPSPGDLPPVRGKGFGKKGAETVEVRKPQDDEPFCGLVFKVLPAKTGDLSWVRVYSGTLSANSRALNPAADKKENISQLWLIHATKREQQVESVHAGDIVGLVGLRNTITGDTLCDARHPIQLETIQFPETVISMAIEPESTTERKKLQETLDLLKRQDPTFKVSGEETGQTLISGMGELHLEIIKNRLLRDFNLNVKFHKPQVSYRETIDHAVEVTGECHRQIAGQQLFGKVTLRMEPASGDGPPVAILTRLPPEALPESLLVATLDALKSRGEGGGVIGGFPLMKLRVIVLRAEWNEQLSDERAFRMAADDAFNKGLELGGKVLLEPIMKLDIITPEDYLGDFVGDLQQRRATIVTTDNRGGIVAIEAHAPLSQLFGYSSAMRSLSQGRAGCSMEPLAYAPASPEVMKSYQI